MSKFRVAAIQMPTVENKMENVKAVRHYLDEIRDQKIDFVVLPEMFCCPYETGKFPEYAEEEGGPVDSSFCLCKRIQYLFGGRFHAGKR